MAEQRIAEHIALQMMGAHTQDRVIVLTYPTNTIASRGKIITKFSTRRCPHPTALRQQDRRTLEEQHRPSSIRCLFSLTAPPQPRKTVWHLVDLSGISTEGSSWSWLSVPRRRPPYRIYGSRVPAPPIYSTMPINRAEDYEG